MNLSASSELIVNAQRIKARLRTPPNAKPDPGIDLTRKPRLGFTFVGEPRPMVKTPQVIPIATVEQVQDVPVVVVLEPPRVVINCKHVIRKVAEFYGTPVADLIGPSRVALFVLPRFVASYLCKEVLGKSYPEIGRAMGGRDHTTALSAVRQIKRWIRTDGELASDVAHLEAQLIEEMEGGA